MARLALLVFAVGLATGCQTLEKWFGPDQVKLGEAYADQTDGPTFDHAAFTAVLEAVVREDGRVDYPKLAADPSGLDAYLAALASLTGAAYDALPRNEKLALLINAYNAFTLKLIAERWPVKSIQDIPASERWDHRRWKLAGMTVSLNDIEHEHLRKKFREPRMHFAVNCASEGCPPIRRFAYTGADIDAQLQGSATRAHADPRWLQLKGDTVYLTRLYLWYRGDFEQVAGSPVAFAARFSPPLAEKLAKGEVTVEIMEYDWAINLAR
ncbi:MAG: DUF547 domain-containing protein [Myxococcales bacterium]|nr:DUF547 domain-containing protein [Myxococcales bacterium]